MNSIEKGGSFVQKDSFIDSEIISDINEIMERIKKAWAEENLPAMISNRERDIKERVDRLKYGEQNQILLNNKKIVIKKLNKEQGYEVTIKEI
jgi:hypothetical protein